MWSPAPWSGLFSALSPPLLPVAAAPRATALAGRLLRKPAEGIRYDRFPVCIRHLLGTLAVAT